MYQNCCKKCGSISLHTEVKGNNTGLYCDDCGAFQKWLGKDELRAFEYANKSRGLRATAKLYDEAFVNNEVKYSLQGTTQGRYLTGGVPPVRFSM